MGLRTQIKTLIIGETITDATSMARVIDDIEELLESEKYRLIIEIVDNIPTGPRLFDKGKVWIPLKVVLNAIEKAKDRI